MHWIRELKEGYYSAHSCLIRMTSKGLMNGGIILAIGSQALIEQNTVRDRTTDHRRVLIIPQLELCHSLERRSG